MTETSFRVVLSTQETSGFSEISMSTNPTPWYGGDGTKEGFREDDTTYCQSMIACAVITASTGLVVSIVTLGPASTTTCFPVETAMDGNTPGMASKAL